jgi:hypothetical protein
LNWLPTIQVKPFDALRIHSKIAHCHKAELPKIPQSATLLHLDYARHIDPEIATADPFFALQDIFRFAAFSESQFLNVVQMSVLNEVAATSILQHRDPSISNLLHLKQILERHIQRLKENITFLENYQEPQLIRPLPLEKTEKSRHAVRTLRRDFHSLIEQAQHLSKQCERGMDVVMSNTVIRESRDAMAQAEGVAKLTRLAFVFIPLSLVTSFFGMNFVELIGGDGLSIWVFFLTSAPVLLISFAFLKFEKVNPWAWFRRIGSRVRSGRDSDGKGREQTRLGIGV